METDPQFGLQSGEEGPDPPENETPATDWFRVGVLAAASALAGGLAVAWYYRNTLARLRQAAVLEEGPDVPRSGDGEGI